jgi:hypothetical protein
MGGVIKMESYKYIKNAINALKIEASEELIEQLNILQDQHDFAGSAEYTHNDLSALLKHDSDILDSGVIEEDSQLWSDIRNIQDVIISDYAIHNTIELTIGRDTLGDANTDADNARYARAVQKAIESEYPEATVSVDLAEHSNCYVKYDMTGDITENVRLISNRVWDGADY